MLGKLLKSAFEGIKKKKQKNQTKKPKDITAQEVREHREHREDIKNQEPEKSNDAQDQNVQVGILAADNAKNAVIIPDKTPALEEIQKTKNNVTNSIIEPKKEKNNNKNNKTQNIASLKNFLGDELKSMSDSINKKIDSININNNKITQTNINVNKDILEVNKDALEVQKESLEEQKEAEYKSEHRFKETIKSKAKGMINKGSSMIKNGAGAVKDKVKGNSGILGMIGKLLGGAYLLKTFWPLIEGKLWPFIKDKIFPFIKDHIKETVMALGLAKLLLDPIGSLKLAVKGFSKLLGTLGGIAMKLGKFAAKGLFNLVKGVTKLAMDGVSSLASKAGELAKQGINKVKDMATAGLTKVKDMAMTGLSSAADKVKGLTAKVGEKFGAFTKNMSAKMSGMGEKMASIGSKVKDIGSKLVEKGIGGAMKIGKGIGGVLKVLKPLAKIVPFLGLIVTVWDLLETFFPDFMTEVKSMFSLEKMQEIGSEIWTSIKSAVSGIGDWISEKIGAVVDGYANLLRNTPGIPNAVVDMIFGKDPKYEQQKLNEKDAKTAQAKLEDSGAIETNWTGKDEIKDWSAVEKYRPAVLQEFIDSGDYSDSDNKKLQAIIDKKAAANDTQGIQGTQNTGKPQEKGIRPTKGDIADKLGVAKYNIGGWTGEGKKDEIAGVVHKKEFVLSETMLKELGAKKSANDTNGSASKQENKSEKWNTKLLSLITNINETKETKETKNITNNENEAEISYSTNNTNITNNSNNTNSTSSVSNVSNSSAPLKSEGKLADELPKPKKVTKPSSSGPEKIKPINLDKIKDKDIFTLGGSAARGGFAKMNKAQKHNVKAMGYEFAKETGRKMSLSSAYRSVPHQRKLYERKYAQVQKNNPKWSPAQVKQETRRWVAPPGRSAHNTGLAVDIDYHGKGKKSPDVDKAISMGLFTKYNLKRPLAHEAWHIVPADLSFKEQNNMVNKLAKADATGTFSDKDIANGAFRDNPQAPETSQEAEISYSKPANDDKPKNDESKTENPIAFSETDEENSKATEIKAKEPTFDTSTEIGKKRKERYDTRFNIVPEKFEAYKKAYESLDDSEENKPKKSALKAKLEYFPGLIQRIENGSTTSSDDSFAGDLAKDKNSDGGISVSEKTYAESREMGEDFMEIFQQGMGFLEGEDGVIGVGNSALTGLIDATGFGNDLKGESELQQGKSWEERASNFGSGIGNASAGLLGTLGGGITNTLGLTNVTGVEAANGVKNASKRTADFVSEKTKAGVAFDKVKNSGAVSKTKDFAAEAMTKTKNFASKGKEKAAAFFGPSESDQKTKDNISPLSEQSTKNASSTVVGGETKILDDTVKASKLGKAQDNGETLPTETSGSSKEQSKKGLGKSEKSQKVLQKPGEEPEQSEEEKHKGLLAEAMEIGGSFADVGNSAITGLIDATGFGNDLKGESELQQGKSWEDRGKGALGAISSSATGLLGTLGGGITNSLGLTNITGMQAQKHTKNAFANTGNAIKGQMDKYGVTDKFNSMAQSSPVASAKELGAKGLTKAKSFGSSMLSKAKGLGASFFGDAKKSDKTDSTPGNIGDIGDTGTPGVPSITKNEIAMNIPKAANDSGGELRKQDGTANRLKEQSKNSLSKDDIEIKTKRESNPDIGNATRKLAAKSSKESAPIQQAPQPITNITQVMPEPAAELSLSNTDVRNPDTMMIGTLF